MTVVAWDVVRPDRRDPVDVRLGAAIRARRKAVGVTQRWVAAQCGVTFQQFQKYERGTNRLVISRLVTIAALLGCTPGDLLRAAGLEPPVRPGLRAVARSGGRRLTSAAQPAPTLRAVGSAKA